VGDRGDEVDEVPARAVGRGHFATEGAVVGWSGHDPAIQVLSPGATHVLSAGATHVLSPGVPDAATIHVLSPLPAADTEVVFHVLSCAPSLFAPARPLSAPKAKAAEKAATSAERSILLCIVGFVLI
jgi:hypothetical protein